MKYSFDNNHHPMTTNCKLLYGSNISAFISHDAKKGCLMKPLEVRLFHPCSKSIHNSTTVIDEVYVAFPPALSRKVLCGMC